jgi:hypothetical protein
MTNGGVIGAMFVIAGQRQPKEPLAPLHDKPRACKLLEKHSTILNSTTEKKTPRFSLPTDLRQLATD